MTTESAHPSTGRVNLKVGSAQIFFKIMDDEAEAGEGSMAEPMDNAAFERDPHGEHAPRRPMATTTTMTTVELGEFATTPRTSAASGAPLCRPDLCRAMVVPQVKPPGLRPNPWHRYKTVLLVATIVGLVVWAVVYVLLVHFQYL